MMVVLVPPFKADPAVTGVVEFHGGEQRRADLMILPFV